LKASGVSPAECVDDTCDDEIFTSNMNMEGVDNNTRLGWVDYKVHFVQI